jgi:hypothetical protein
VDDTRHVWIRQGLREIVQALGEQQQSEDTDAASAATVLEAKGEAAPQSPPSESPPARQPLQQGASVNVRCLPAHDEADQIVGLMIAQVLQRRGFAVVVADTASMASELVASIDAETTDVVIVSALPPKAALHARYLLKTVVSHSVDFKVIVGLWTNDKKTAAELINTQTVTSLDALQDQLDQMTPMILLGKAPSSAEDPKGVLVVAK